MPRVHRRELLMTILGFLLLLLLGVLSWTFMEFD
jgi:hypothetical protein